MPRTTVDVINEALSLQAAGGRYNPAEARVGKGHVGGGQFTHDPSAAPLAARRDSVGSKNAHFGVVDRNKQIFVKPAKPKGGGKKKKKKGGGGGKAKKAASVIPVHPAARVGVAPLKRSDPRPDRSPGGGVPIRFVSATGVWVYSDGDVYDSQGFQTPAVAARQAG